MKHTPKPTLARQCKRIMMVIQASCSKNILETHCMFRLLTLILLCTALSSSMNSRLLATDLSGTWSGNWISCSTGHQGPLTATFTRCDDTHYRVRFSGRFFKIFPFHYTVTLKVVEESETEVTLSGNSYLGRLFGAFCYTATADASYFNARYSSKKDHGMFKLSKCHS